MVLHVGGNGGQPFVIKGKIKNQPFTTMIDSGSPITIFTQADLRELLIFRYDICGANAENRTVSRL